MAVRRRLGPRCLSPYRVMGLHPPFVLGFFSLFPIQDAQQWLKEETTERSFSSRFPAENQKGIQEKQLPLCTIPSRAGSGRETQRSYRSLAILPFLHRCKLPGEREKPAILRRGECGRARCARRRGGDRFTQLAVGSRPR